MTDNVRVVGRVGVAPLHLIGGPLDGIVKWGVVGSALVVRLKKPAPQRPRGDTWSIVMFGGGPIEGEEWKVTDAQGVTRHYQHHAVYVPQVQHGKATDRVLFEGIFAVEVRPKAKPAPPQPEYEAKEDEDEDDDGN